MAQSRSKYTERSEVLTKYFVSPSATLEEVMSVIDRSGTQIVLVVNQDRCLVGTITDGDFRRAMLRGFPMTTRAKQVMYRDFCYLPSTATAEEALALMRHKAIHQVPVLDDAGHVIHLFRLEDFIKLKSRPNPVIIMAGGKGERLKGYTKDCPKPMLTIGNKPILEIILEQAIDAGFRDFYLSVNYLKDQIKDYFGNGASWCVSIEYLEEDKPLGTAGALSLLPAMRDYPLLVLNGDILTRVAYGRLLRFHSEHESEATLCVREHTTQIPYGVVRMDDVTVQAMEEKPVLNHYVNAGIYLLEPGLLELVPPDQFFDMPQLIEKAIAHEHRVNAFPIHEYWLDIGLPETLDRAHEEW
jgi:dTDP-glucose pyrophosphorylase/CBS domain-containing protein